MITEATESSAVRPLDRLRSGDQLSLTEYFGSLKAEYEFANPSRHLRDRKIPSNGASADYHTGSDAKHLRRIEYANDIAQNDTIVGSGLRGAVCNIVQGGFPCDHATGSKELDKRLEALWDEYTNSPELCDLQGEHDFTEMTQMVLESVFTSGDILASQLDGGAADGRIELLEAYRLRSPGGKSAPTRCVNGVELDENRRRVRYWVTKDDIGIRPARSRDLIPLDAYDEHGYRRVLHLYRARRKTQTRGMTAMAPIGNTISMHDDINFAVMVAAQIQNCFSILRERAYPPPDKVPSPRAKEGEQRQESLSATGFGRLFENLYPGKEVFGAIGEQLKGFSPTIPSIQYFDHVRLMLTFISVNLDLPLIVLLMDANETNFSGWRGAWDQAKLRLKRWQEFLVKRWYSPIYRWKVRRWLEADAELKALVVEGVDPYRHEFQLPTWPYINPLQDSQADILNNRAAMTSPRRIQAARGVSYTDIVDERVADHTYQILACNAAAEAILKKYPNSGVTWFHLLALPTPDSVSASVAIDNQQHAAPGTAAKDEMSPKQIEPDDEDATDDD